MPFNNPFAIERVLEVIDLLALPAESRVLDVGCGTGELLARLSERPLHCTGIDVDEASIHAARLIGPKATFSVADASS